MSGRAGLIEKVARAIAGLNYCDTDAMVLPCVVPIGPKGFPFVPNGVEPVPVWMLYRSEASVVIDAILGREVQPMTTEEWVELGVIPSSERDLVA